MNFKISTILFLAIFSFTLPSAMAQGGCFRNSFSTSSMDIEGGKDILQDSTGAVLLLGYAEVLGGHGYEVTLTKTDNQGVTIFSRHYGTDLGGFSGSNDDKGIGIVESWDGNGYIILAETDFDGDNDIYLMKVDLSGNPVWSRIVGTDRDNYPEKIIRTADRNYVVVSTIQSDATLGWEFHAMKIDESGATLWQTTVGGPDSEYANSVVELNNGNLILVGYRRNYGDDLKDMFIVNIDGAGNYVNSFCLGTADFDEGAVDVALSTPGNLMILGDWTGNAGSRDILITQLNTSGTSLSRKIGQPTRQDWGNELLRLPSGQYVIAGQVGANPINNTASWDAYFLRLNANGGIVGSNRYGGDSTKEGFSAVTRSNSGAFMMYGWTDGTPATGLRDHFFVTTNNMGQSGCCDLGPVGDEEIYTMTDYEYGYEMEVELTDTAEVFFDDEGVISSLCPSKRSIAEDLENEASQVNVYPNPSSGEVQLDIPEELLSGKLTITNTLGQIIHQQILTNHRSTIKLLNQQAGVYLLHIQKGERQLVKRIILN